MSNVAGGRETRDSDNRSSIWMSVAFRSCVARTLLSFSGCDDSDGGESRRVRGVDTLFAALDWIGAKSEVLSMVTAGAMTGNNR